MRVVVSLLGISALLVVAGCGGSSGSSGSSKSSSTTTSSQGGSGKLVALVSDIGKFNDRSFNQSQKEGLDKAHTELGVQTLPLQSNST
jgi:basic membrane protein A